MPRVINTKMMQSVCLQCRRPKFNPWIRKFAWRRKQQPTPVLLPEESHGQRNLADDRPRDTESDMTEQLTPCLLLGFPGGSVGKESACNAGDLGSIPGLGRFPGEGNSNPLQYTCLENPMDGRAWFRLLFLGPRRVRHD